MCIGQIVLCFVFKFVCILLHAAVALAGPTLYTGYLLPAVYRDIFVYSYLCISVFVYIYCIFKYILQRWHSQDPLYIQDICYQLYTDCLSALGPGWASGGRGSESAPHQLQTKLWHRGLVPINCKRIVLAPPSLPTSLPPYLNKSIHRRVRLTP